MFYDLHVHTNLSVGENSFEEIVDFARKIGLTGIGIVKYFSPSEETWPESTELDIVKVLMIKTSNPEEFERLVRKARNRCEVLMAHGGDYDINRLACENSYVDVLSRPEFGRKDSGLDHICIKAAQENNVAIEINFREILESFKKQRVYALSAMRENIRICKSYGANIITTSGSLSKWDMRSGRELAAIANILGMDLGEAIGTVSTVPEQKVKTNREKLLDKRWEGVSVVEE
jgi:ribonuclease P/MRP protein subunit RPP1